MKNKLTSHDRIANVIEFAVNQGSGYAASEAASTIDKEFILIPKSDLPAMGIKPVYSPVKGEVINRPVAGSACTYGNAPSRYYWERARSFMAIAQYVEAEESKQAERELAGKREEAYHMLYPSSPPLWDFQGADPEVKARIEVVVNLMNQVDELKDSK